MNSKHRKTLLAIFEKPVRKNILWSEIESLFSAIGANIVNKGGSVVTIEMNGKPHTFHRPHPEKEAKAYKVKP
ncbi:MAG: type II toxin-antitoxin system HicA family toxin [Gammaproteobacteria bacterium]